MINAWLDSKFKNLKKGEKLFVVDLETVSLFPPENLERIAMDNEKYKKTPFLYLIASYSRNKSLDWASRNLNYSGKIQKGSWVIYSFEKT